MAIIMLRQIVHLFLKIKRNVDIKIRAELPSGPFETLRRSLIDCVKRVGANLLEYAILQKEGLGNEMRLKLLKDVTKSLASQEGLHYPEDSVVGHNEQLPAFMASLH